MKIPDIIMLSPNRVWRTYLGGKILDELEEKEKPEDAHFPEDWIASIIKANNKGREEKGDEGLSKVRIQADEYYLKQLIESYPFELVGKKHFNEYGATTQFLLKFLDSAIRLHLQCHPTIEFAKKYLNSNHGKTEAYYVLGIRDDVKIGYIYLGFKDPPTVKEFKKTIENQDIEKLMSYFERVPVKEGDCFFIPGGLPHAIGEGIFMIEIMEPTDYCVRIEFKRGDYELPFEARFMNNSVDFAISMFNIEKSTKDDIFSKYFLKPKLIKIFEDESKEYVLIDNEITDRFRLKKLIIKKGVRKRENSFYIGIVIKGVGIIDSGKIKHNINYGDKFFIPYKTKEIEIRTESNLEIIVALPPRKTILEKN